MKKAPAFTKTEYEQLAAFRFALRQFLRFSEDAANRAGITPQQHQALLAIKGFPGREEVTLSELAERLQLLHHSVVGLVDRLVVESLVVRKTSKVDRREVYIRLTAQGTKVLAALTEIHRAQLARIGPGLRTLLEQLGPPDASA